ncbi:hypothetical protein ACWNT8_11005 [Pigmentibacter ruber]|uniref:hypothetical protein n=1 Tax=Pigmentibacter ruber TaxID=2683196 RepID=UPI00131E32E8|nr:hypothetical protein [Pigmentibacter ruber]BFD32168.1 hypothetical protein GTC16762_17860 [Pigmentibacter ruber]
MTNILSFDWEKDDYVRISGMVDENADFSELYKKHHDILFLDLKGVHRINSSGVRKWVLALDKLKDVELHYINCSFPVVDQLSMVPEFINKKSYVESFDARYVCENDNTTHIFNLVVGFDIQPGLKKYEDGPERFCPNCKNRLEFDHNPDSYLFFLSNLHPKKKSAS